MSRVVVVGAGAIGSHLLSHLARSSRVSKVTIIDAERYDASNVRGQQIDVRHVGLAKAIVQARRLRRINPDLPVVPLVSTVEDVPLGALRGDVLVACLDSRIARMAVNQIAWRLRASWIDAGVDGDAGLARVRVFQPAEGAACLECAWDQPDYDALEQRYACGADTSPGATRAPAALSALAASLQALECEKLLAGDHAHSLSGRDVLMDTTHHTHSVTAYPRNPSCRMPDHSGWHIGTFNGTPSSTTLDEVLAIGSTLRGASDDLAIGVAGQRFVTELACAGCGTRQPAFRLERSVRGPNSRCPDCNGSLAAVGFHVYDHVPAGQVPVDAMSRPLSRLGIREHDVITLSTPLLAAHYEIGSQRNVAMWGAGDVET
jgi:molybdopterin/thiamine biosynthesis adenylyltransferase